MGQAWAPAEPQRQPASVRLALRFDVDRLVDAYHQTRRLYAPAEHRAGHDGKSYHQGWAGVSLRSNGGRWDDSRPARPSPELLRDTEVLARVPYWAEVLDAFPCPKESVRISVLAPNGRIIPHQDDDVGFEYGRLRIHVPILTSPDVVMEIGGERCTWPPGEVWYGDFGRTHTVVNSGRDPRVHLLLDVQLNDALLRLFPRDFVAAQPRIVIFPESRTLPREELAAFACRFVIARQSREAELLLNELYPDERAAIDVHGADFEAEIAMAAHELRLHLNGTPVYALEPIGGSRFRLCGWPLRYELHIVKDPARVIAIELTDGDFRTSWEAQ